NSKLSRDLADWFVLDIGKDQGHSQESRHALNLCSYNSYSLFIEKLHFRSGLRGLAENRPVDCYRIDPLDGLVMLLIAHAHITFIDYNTSLPTTELSLRL